MSVRVCVVGSINMDLVVRAPRFAQPGETLLGESFETHPGGKGANQAVAACRLGASVDMVGCVGDDGWGADLRGALASEGVGTARVARLTGVVSGVGLITVLPDGENAIVVAPGANARLTPSHVEEAESEIAAADVLILQLEVPLEANLRAAEIAATVGTAIVLNAAPAREAPAELLQRTDTLVLNLAEARALLEADESVSTGGLARRLDALGPNRVAVTQGAEGAVLFDGETLHRCGGFAVNVVDTTAAGDAFVATLAIALAEGTRAMDALGRACAAGACAATIPGALSSLPRRADVDALLKSSAVGTAQAGL
ncbi:MAG: ribokinase [Planctomycetota bacterium]|nr:ribokinase [Planctomycetota bacterium]